MTPLTNPWNWLLSLLLLLPILFYLYARHKLSYWSRRGIYSPPCSLLFGHFRDVVMFRSSPSLVLGQLHKAYPEHRFLGVYILYKPILLLRDPELMKQILVKDFRVFPNRYFAAKRKSDIVGSASLFSIDNPPWKYLRVKLTPGFTSVRLKQLFGRTLENAGNMRAYLAGKVPEDGRQVSLEVRAISNKYTTDVISSLTFGIRTNCFEEPETEFYKRTRRIFDTGLARSFELFANYFFPGINDLLDKSFLGKDTTDYLRYIFWESMNEREKTGAKRYDVIDLLLELKNEKQDSVNFKFEGDYLLSQSAIFFVAGLETSAITMCFTLLSVSTYPDIQKRIRDELREKMIDGQLTYDSIAEMTYLNQVVSETLRLYPPATIIDRLSVADYQIPGTDITIDKGTGVYVTLKGIHEDPDYHPDPQKFDPDRFSEERKPNIKPCSYMPFGEGPRICIGMRTGLLQALVGLVTILSEYEVSLDPNYENKVNPRAMFTSPLNGIHLYFRRSPVFD